MSAPDSNVVVDLTARRDKAGGIGSISPALLARARQARQLRSTMSAFVHGDLLVDPAWDMMIDLFIAFETGERLYVKDLILKSGESTASAMRRIDRLQQAALLTRHQDPFDQRRVYVGITDKGRAAMTSMLNHLFDADKMVGEGIAMKPRSYGSDPHPIR